MQMQNICDCEQMRALIKRVHSPLLWEHYGCGTCRFESIISLRLLLLHAQLVWIDRTTLLFLFKLRLLNFLLKILTTGTWIWRRLKCVEWLMLRKCSAFPISFFISCSSAHSGLEFKYVSETLMELLLWIQDVRRSSKGSNGNGL